MGSCRNHLRHCNIQFIPQSCIQLTKPKHVTDDKLLIKLRLDLFLYSFINKYPTTDTTHSKVQQYHAMNNNKKTEDICVES